MIHYFSLALIIFSLTSCNVAITSKSINQQDNDSVRIEESFMDSAKIGVKGFFKTNVKQIREFEHDVFMTFDLFKKQNSK